MIGCLGAVAAAACALSVTGCAGEASSPQQRFAECLLLQATQTLSPQAFQEFVGRVESKEVDPSALAMLDEYPAFGEAVRLKC